MSTVHHIRRQVIELDRGPLELGEAADCYAELERFQLQHFLPALERALNAVADRRTVTIDRLELDLTWAAGRGLAAVNLEDLDRQVRERITATAAPTTAPALSAGQPLLHYLRTGQLPWTVEELPLAAPPPAALRALAAAAGQLLGTEPHAPRRLQWLLTTSAPLLYLPDTLRELFRLIARSAPDLSARLAGRGSEHLADRLDVRSSSSVQDVLAGNLPDDRPELPTYSSTDNKQLASETRSTAPDQTEEYFTEGAGLVLLHPYISWLLERTGSETDPARAAGLLHYAVWPDRPPAEWRLLLPKLLLGLSPEDLLLPVTPDPAEQTITDELLAGVLEHWGALGSTSIDGLRVNFLQRPGKLVRSDRDWQLFVERRDYDVLLDRLPWGISVVKTPAMPEPLQTIWS